MTGTVTGRAPVRGPEVTVREDLATGTDALHVVTGLPGTDPVELARTVAADYLDGAGMVVVEAPVRAPRPAAPGGPSPAVGLSPAVDLSPAAGLSLAVGRTGPGRARPAGPATTGATCSGSTAT